MSNWAVVFLGIIALASLVQAVFLVALAIAGRRVARRLDELEQRIDRELRPSLESLNRIARNLGEVSDLAVLGARRMDATLADLLDKVEDTATLIRRTLIRPLGPLVDIAAFLKGLRRGLQVYQQLRGFDRPQRGSAHRSYAEDEHLFI
jgi:hypothetical protein